VSPFVTISLAGIVLLVALASAVRSIAFASFVGVLLGLNLLITAGLESQFGLAAPLAWYLQAAATLHFAALLRPRLRGRPYRALISFPAHVWMAGTFLAFPWAIVASFGFAPGGWWVPFVLAVAGLLQSLRAPRELVQLCLDGVDSGEVVRRCQSVQRYSLAKAPPSHGRGRSLRVVQITDPHLGPFMRSLRRAMAPLKELPGRVFACRGNHDLEVPDLVAQELEAIGARLLIDETESVQTSVGTVQIVGLDHIWRGRTEHFAKVFEGLAQEASALRLVLLHDPTAFANLPLDSADLVLSGHTHGGHLGLVSFGLNWTTIGGFLRIPDHGLWSRGRARLYVHRANGHYGFPLRIGVPAEESVLRLVLDSA
jgi:hypothetical protein